MASETSVPRLVSVKRKRDAESVDVLFIQEGKQTKRARTPFIFKRVENLQDKATAGSEKNGPDTTKRPQTPRDKSRMILKPREFHLERPSSQGSVVKKSQAGSGRVGKSAQQKRLAVLVETSAKRQGSVENLIDLARGRPVQQSLPPSPIKKPLLDAPKQQLKPRASAAELRWREEKWGPRGAASRSVSRGPTPSASDTEDLKLAEKLDAFAREQDSRLAQNQTSDSSPRKRPLKFQPKPSAAGRKQPITAAQDDSPASNMSDGESDYEYDTYERVPYIESLAGASEQTSATGMDVDIAAANDPALAGKSIGVLVITDEDEDLWATYQEIEDSSDEFETDDEDENAEDYYGNDYPEDELDSEDEYNRGAYGFRYANSDDEQWGDGIDDDDDGDGGVSDDEQAPRRRQQQQPAGQAAGSSWSNEFASPVQNRGLDPY